MINNAMVVKDDQKDFQQLLEKATVLLQSGLLPKEIDTPAKAVTIALAGQEIGIPAMQSLKEIYVVEGKAQFKSELMLQLAMQRIPGFKHEILKYTRDEVIVKFFRHGIAPFEYGMTLEDAKTSGWVLKKDGGTKNQWKTMPDYMLFNRIISFGLKVFAPDYKFTGFEYDIANLETAEQAVKDLTEPIRYEENSNIETIHVDNCVFEETKPIIAEEPEPSPAKDIKYFCESAYCGVEITKKVHDFSLNKFGKAKCFDCQKDGR